MCCTYLINLHIYTLDIQNLPSDSENTKRTSLFWLHFLVYICSQFLATEVASGLIPYSSYSRQGNSKVFFVSKCTVHSFGVSLFEQSVV